jgi:hypothetical protein
MDQASRNEVSASLMISKAQYHGNKISLGARQRLVEYASHPDVLWRIVVRPQPKNKWAQPSQTRFTSIGGCQDYSTVWTFHAVVRADLVLTGTKIFAAL